VSIQSEVKKSVKEAAIALGLKKKPKRRKKARPTRRRRR